ncbi:UNVERIFIED_CONTAM: hypothetical protein HDU68_011939 [Siphonaria sp. JEL0065]|nr:hypothetical protein HDU68_011939 [Siphonaria sp. JEL0065]
MHLNPLSIWVVLIGSVLALRERAVSNQVTIDKRSDLRPQNHFGLNTYGGPPPIMHHDPETARSMVEPMNLYIIWYGSNWKKADKTIVTDFLGGLSKSDFWKISQKYWQRMPDGSKKYITGNLKIAGQVDDHYSLGKFLYSPLETDYIENVVSVVVESHVKNGGLAYDPNGIAPNPTPGINFTSPDYVYAFISNPSACGTLMPYFCGASPNFKSPNGNVGVDVMLTFLAHEIAEAASNPDYPTVGWNTDPSFLGTENADLCNSIFGSNRKLDSKGGYYYNQEWNGRRYLLQQLWDPEIQQCGPVYNKATQDCTKFKKIFPTLNVGDDCCSSGYAECANGKITGIDVSYNGLTGDANALVKKVNLNFPNINRLLLGGNDFTATKVFPKALCDLLHLEDVWMDDSLWLSGTSLPDCLGNLSSLRIFGIEGSGLAGNIPSSIFKYSSPFILSLSHNNLTGTIPKSLARKSTLKGLYLNDNPLLHGAIPEGFDGFHGQSEGPSDENGPYQYANFEKTKLCYKKGYKGPKGGAPECTKAQLSEGSDKEDD